MAEDVLPLEGVEPVLRDVFCGDRSPYDMAKSCASLSGGVANAPVLDTLAIKPKLETRFRTDCGVVDPLASASSVPERCTAIDGVLT